MIPQRVKLKGFLCYKDEQAVDFQGSATLWMLSGLNGSGKSAVFDAVTYALFGHHRGGATGAVELINKDSDTLLVEFDFLLDGHMCRAKRTLKRDAKGGAKGTQQMLAQSAGKFEPVPDTTQKREFDKWVADNIGLNYDTFTSSVLLLQGKAEKLLDSRPEGRREVLASIVNLDKYERLHAKADERRKGLEAEVKLLNQRLAALPSVDPLELGAARLRIGDAEQARSAARSEVERLQSMETMARLWQAHQAQIAQARSRLARARELMAGSAAIEQAMERLRDLRDVVPKLHEITVLRGQANQAAQQTGVLDSQRQLKLTQRGEKESALRQADERRRRLQAQIDGQSRQSRELSERLRVLGVQLNKLAECERQEQEAARARHDLAALPADPAGRVASAREALERAEAVGRLVPVLDRFRGRRDELTQQIAAANAADDGMRAVQSRGTTMKAEAETARKRRDESAEVLARAAEQATEARTLFTTARQALAELSLLDGSHVCRHCGQALTAGHMDEEKKRRSKEEKAADAKAKSTARALDEARQRDEAARTDADRTEKAYQDAREEYREHKTRVEAARAAIDRLQRECAAVYGELPPEQARRVSPRPPADWATTAYPTAADVDGLRAEARAADAARRALRDAEAAQQKHAALEQRLKLAADTLERLSDGLPKDRAALRTEHGTLDAQEKALFREIDAGRAAVTTAEKDAGRLTQERDAVQAEIHKVESELSEKRLVQENATRGIAAQMRALPDAWKKTAESVGMQQFSRYQTEREELERNGTDTDARELEHARANAQVLQQDVDALERKDASFPEESRQKPEAVGVLLREARAQDDRAERELSTAQQQLSLLETYERQRKGVRDELLAREGELSTARTLAELLGRERLQLYLVRQAERQVVEYGNAVLDRLSGGQLYLKLSGETDGEAGTGKALELEAYNRAAGDRPINVSFLSGSQKFRVAVSLALAIGQYASRQQRPIESVIIDEGFGCLDSQGRQVMIQELQSLRSQMRCILLVSHQEDFAEAFSDGYQFKLEDGATKVTRFQR